MDSSSPCSSSGRFFAQKPDPEIYFPVAGHVAIWKALRSALVASEGLVLLTGEPGVGKSMLLLRLKAIGLESMEMAVVADGHQESDLFLHQLLSVMDPAWHNQGEEPRLENLFPLLQQRANQHHRLLLAIDDAHRLSVKNLELLGLLCQYRHENYTPLHLLLVGRPETAELLWDKSGETLAKILSSNLLLAPLTPGEVVEYVKHFMGANKEHPLRITLGGWMELMGRSQGMPRRINRILRHAIARASKPNDCVITGMRIREVCPAGRFMPFPWDLAPFFPWLLGGVVALFLLGFSLGKMFAPPPLPVQVVEVSSPQSCDCPKPECSQPVPTAAVQEKVEPPANEEVAGVVPSPTPPSPPPAVTAAIPLAQPVPVERPARLKGMVYTVQSGSFSRRENAEKIRQRLVKKGFPAYLQTTERGGQTMYSIRVDFSQQQAAEKAGKEIQSAVDLPVLVLKNTSP